MATVKRITPEELQRRLAQTNPPLLLDVRRSAALVRSPLGIRGAVPILLDETELRIPDLPRQTEIVAYCLCSGQASSTRLALRLAAAGYTDVHVLEGGLPAWETQGLPLSPIGLEHRDRIVAWLRADAAASGTEGAVRLIAESAFLAGQTLPARREMAVLFVDMVDSTKLLFAHAPEKVLSLIQSFMEVVVEVAVQHCGDVHDFEGDGAMLYFAGPGEAVPAAFNLRTALAARRHCEPELPQARFALDGGPLVMGYVGARERRALSFIGPSVNAAARILKLAQPEGIVATERIVTEARRTDPDLAAQFRPLAEKQHLKGWAEPVALYQA